MNLLRNTSSKAQFCYTSSLHYCLTICCCRTRNVQYLTKAWEQYSEVFRKMTKQLAALTDLELHDVSPKLLGSRDLQLAVPGTYRANQPVVRIAHFSPSMRVIESKQHPRKLQIHGSDGVEYAFLLKG